MGNFRRIKLPPKVRAGEDVKAADHNAVIRAIEGILAEVRHVTMRPSNDIGIKHSAGGTTAWIKKKGRAVGEELRWKITFKSAENKVFVGEGIVNYLRIVNWDTFSENDEIKAQFVRGKVPKIDGIALDAEDRPSISVEGFDNVIVWLIVQAQRCSESGIGDEPERIEATPKGEKPEIEDTEVAIEIARFDLEDIEGSEPPRKRVKNLKYRLRSDWEQPFLCDGNTDSSDDDDIGSDEDDGGSSSSGEDSNSDDSSGDDDPEPPSDCEVRASVRWVNKVDCFPSAPAYEGGFPCTPGRFVFEIAITFSGTDPYNKPCPAWAYGVSMEPGKWINPENGREEHEAVWLNDRSRVLRFAFEHAPACGTATVVWRARGFGPLKDASNHVIPSCCGGKGYHGSVTTKKLGPVCGCGCSSSGDLDGDGIPNQDDGDVDGDGFGNADDEDVDGDGKLDGVDPDIDGDGIPNDDDTSPWGTGV